jgi:hypothetical protein
MELRTEHKRSPNGGVIVRLSNSCVGPVLIMLILAIPPSSFGQNTRPMGQPKVIPGPAGGEQPLNIAGVYSGIRVAKQAVVRDAVAMASLWKQHMPNGSAPTPQVDFKKYDVVAVFAGGKNTGGHSISIDSLEVKGKVATVHVKLHKPDPHAMVTQAFTYPFAMKAVAKLPRDVKFEITEVTGGP